MAETITSVTAMISNVGFPIFISVTLIYVLKYIAEKFISTLSDMNKQNNKTISAINDTVSENTKSIVELTTLIRHFLCKEGSEDGEH